MSKNYIKTGTRNFKKGAYYWYQDRGMDGGYAYVFIPQSYCQYKLVGTAIHTNPWSSNPVSFYHEASTSPQLIGQKLTKREYRYFIKLINKLQMKQSRKSSKAS